MNISVEHLDFQSRSQWREVYSFFAVLGLILLSRLIFLSADLGNDPDAYRFGINAEKILADGHYYMSRAPGNPLYELVNAPLLVLGGGRLTNLMTMLVSSFGFAAFYLILRYYRIRKSLMLLAVFAFLPVVWISSIITMDYWWALTFLLWAYYLTLTGRPYWGAVLIGLATGCRLTSAFLILPILLMVWQNTREWLKLVNVFFLFAAISLLSWLPLLLSYGFEHFTFVPYGHSVVVGAYRAVRQILGIPALVVLIGAVILSRSKLRKQIPAGDLKALYKELHILLWIGLTVLIFVRVPADPAYLLPALPFLLIVFNSLITASWWIPIGTLIILNNLVSFIAIDSGAYKTTGRLHIKLAAPGVLLKDRMDAWHSRSTIVELQSLKIDVSDDAREPLILTGALMPQVQYYFRHQVMDRKIVGFSPHDTELILVDDRWFGRSVSEEVFKELSAEQFIIYYTSEARYSTRSTFKYDMHDHGAILAF